MRKLFMSFAVAGFLFAGCSSNEVEEFNSSSPDAIKITASTTRAAISNYESLKPGLKVWAKKANNTTSYFVNGINYLWQTNTWKWASGNPVWPADGAADYPMQFYAINPAANEAGKTVFYPTTTTFASLSGNVTIGGPATSLTDLTTISADSQTDVLHATALNVTQKPASGYLPLDFKHILSKINVGIIAGNNTEVHIQSVAVRNLKHTAAYNYQTSVWSTPTTALAGYNYLVVGDGRASFTPNSETAEAIFAPADNRNLMLLPQTGASWDVSTIAKAQSTLASGAYIEVVYRLVKTAGSEIGYTDATDYLDDNPSYTDPTIPSWTYGTIANYGARGLYIKVGFPLTSTLTAASNFTWTPGYGYTYNIKFGTSDAINGNYTDDTFYDEEGNDTGIPITKEDGSGEPVDPGEPVTTNYIYFDLSVTNFNNDEIELQ